VIEGIAAYGRGNGYKPDSEQAFRFSELELFREAEKSWWRIWHVHGVEKNGHGYSGTGGCRAKWRFAKPAALRSARGEWPDGWPGHESRAISFFYPFNARSAIFNAQKPGGGREIDGDYQYSSPANLPKWWSNPGPVPTGRRLVARNYARAFLRVFLRNRPAMGEIRSYRWRAIEAIEAQMSFRWWIELRP